MPSPSVSSPIELEVGRIRELSKSGRYHEALAAAEGLAAEAPENRDVLYLIAANQRCLNRIDEALGTLQRLEEHHPRFSLLHQERGHCYTTLRDAPRAIEAFQRAVNLNPALAASWNMLEHLYGMTGQAGNAATAAGQLSTLRRLAPEVVQAGSLFSDGDLTAAEKILRAFLLKAGANAEAMRLLARIEREHHLLANAERLLYSVLELAPAYQAARLDYARVLIDRQKYPQAREEIDRSLKVEPGNTDCLQLHAAACVGLGQHEAAIAVYRQLLEASPGSADLHLLLGHSLKAIGRRQEATECYQAAARVRPGFGDAYWSLANLKTYRFSEDEIARMRAEEASAADTADRCHLCFALGNALEDRREYEESWRYYQCGNALKRAESHYRPEIAESNTRRQIEICTAGFFAARSGVGAPHPDPIFIVGLPRSGSTLIEQILASHSQVEGTQELAAISLMVADLEKSPSSFEDAHDFNSPSSDLRYPGVLAEMSPEEFRRLGQRYIDDTRAYRTGRPFFIDKMPNNFRHIGLIHLMLPNAKIIDVRREPMACCFSNLKQLYAGGQEFTYSMEDIARYYRNYLDLMRHWDEVLPGRVLRVCYEEVVEDLEGSVHRILDSCGLDFERACVEFHKTSRAVRTPSSEQVRQPIFREGLSQWRNYEPWLATLRDALGDANGNCQVQAATPEPIAAPTATTRGNNA